MAKCCRLLHIGLFVYTASTTLVTKGQPVPQGAHVLRGRQWRAIGVTDGTAEVRGAGGRGAVCWLKQGHGWGWGGTC